MTSPPKSEIASFLEGFTHAPAFIRRYPYYAAVLARLIPVADPSVARMAVSLSPDGRFYLHVNVDSFLTEPQYLRGVLLHEVHHVVLGHLAHPKFADATEPELMDLALEMSANEHIEEPLPNPIVWKAFAAAGIRAGQSTIDRYEKLREALKSGAFKGRPVPGIGEERVDDHRYLRGEIRDSGAVEHTRQILQKATSEAREGLAGDDAPRFLLAGKDPGRLLEELTGVRGPAEADLDWKVALRMFVARARAPVHTYARPNRRFPGRVGEVPGRTYSPRAIERPRLLVAIDTSLSMSLAELAEIARQLGRIAEHARIVVAECDTEIVRVYPFTGALSDVAGRGGTDLRPVFAPSFLGTQKADGVVYFTDGEGPCPKLPPSVPVLWILTKAGQFECPWGERARLERKRRF